MSGRLFLKIEGAKQQVFKGDSEREGRTDWCELHGYTVLAPSTFDADHSHSRAAPEQMAIRVQKKVGPSTPQLAKAYHEGEIITSAVLEYVSQPGDGSGERVEYRITHQNGKVCSPGIALAERKSDTDPLSKQVDLVDDVILSFSVFDHEHPASTSKAIVDFKKAKTG